MGMPFELEKCDRKVTKRGKVVRGDTEDSYEYLGITRRPLGKLQLPST